MNYADRVQETTTNTSMATITLLGAASGGFRTFNNSAPIAVGVKRIPVCVVASTGEWEAGWYTLTSGSLLTRESVVSSSNSDLPVTFPSGTKNVICTPVAALMAAGLTNPDDVGFDIILCAGQSNMEGNPTSDPLIDVGDPGSVFQWANSSADTATYRQIITGVDPLYMPGGVRTGKTGLATWAAKAYMGTIPRNRKILLVPVAVGSTGLVGSVWAAGSPGGTYYERAISDSNLAITAALLMYPNSRFVGTFWAQGEADGLNGTTQAQYAAGLKAVIAGFRSRITGATNSWFIISAMTPSGITNHTGEGVIDLAHTQVAAETDKCVKVPSITGYDSDVHWTAPGARIMGTRLGIATVAAKTVVGSDVTAPTSSSAVVANATPTTVTVNVSESLNTSFVPASSAFTVGGHSVSAVAVQGLTYTLTVDAFVNGEAARTIAYTQPGTNQLRDAAGNLMASFSGLAITNNVLPVDSTAPSFSSAQVANASPTIIQVTMDEALAAVIPANSTFTASGKTVTGVSISGAVVSITVNSAYVNTDTITITYTNPGSGNRLQDAAGNFTATFGPSSVTNNVGAAATAPAQMAAPVATAGDTTASVVMVAPSNGGSTITGYTVTSSPAGGTDSNAGTTGLTHAMTGLTNGTAYTFTATATNSIGTSTPSPASNSVTPSAAAYTTLNASDKASGITLSNGDLTAAATAGFKSVRGIKSYTTGKHYYEYKITIGTAGLCGVGRSDAVLTNFPGSSAYGYGYNTDGKLYFSNAAVQTNSTYTTNDWIGVALDLDNFTIQFYKNGVAQGTAQLLKNIDSGAFIAGTPLLPMIAGNSSTILTNFGAAAWAFAPPAGYTGWSA